MFVYIQQWKGWKTQIALTKKKSDVQIPFLADASSSPLQQQPEKSMMYINGKDISGLETSDDWFVTSVGQNVNPLLN